MNVLSRACLCLGYALELGVVGPGVIQGQDNCFLNGGGALWGAVGEGEQTK